MPDTRQRSPSDSLPLTLCATDRRAPAHHAPGGAWQAVGRDAMVGRRSPRRDTRIKRRKRLGVIQTLLLRFRLTHPTSCSAEDLRGCELVGWDKRHLPDTRQRSPSDSLPLTLCATDRRAPAHHAPGGAWQAVGRDAMVGRRSPRRDTRIKRRKRLGVIQTLLLRFRLTHPTSDGIQPTPRSCSTTSPN